MAVDQLHPDEGNATTAHGRKSVLLCDRDIRSLQRQAPLLLEFATQITALAEGVPRMPTMHWRSSRV